MHSNKLHPISDSSTNIFFTCSIDGKCERRETECMDPQTRNRNNSKSYVQLEIESAPTSGFIYAILIFQMKYGHEVLDLIVSTAVYTLLTPLYLSNQNIFWYRKVVSRR